ncbi:FATC domain protein [Trichuris suis]|nr:FATC domain protein [Trichuris suis]
MVFCALRVRNDDGLIPGPNLLRTLTASQCSIFLVKSVLSALRNGLEKARQLFPRLLSVMEQYPDCRSTFLKESQQVPTWLFLGWLDQILAIFDSPWGCCFTEVLNRIADDYPQVFVVFFPNLCPGRSALCYETLIERLKVNLKCSTAMYDFTKSLMLLSHPDIVLRDAFEELESLTVNYGRKPENEIALEIAKIGSRLLLSDYKPDALGTVWKKYLKKYGPRLELLFSEHAVTVGVSWLEETKRTLLGMLEVAKRVFGIRHCSDALYDYSVWLYQYNSTDSGIHLEIPGQYTGDQKPMPDHHVCINSFGSKLQVLSSLHKPKVISIYGSDGHRHKYIIKTGEDLRQDQRIQHLFKLMNHTSEIGQSGKECKLQIRTYDVIPLGVRVAMIEFLPNVVALEKFFLSPADRQKYQSLALTALSEGPNAILNPGVGASLSPSVYWKSYASATPNAVVRCFRNLLDSIPRHLLRTKLVSCCASADMYCCLRERFIASLAALSVATYVLGIGDRHLDNILIDVSLGELVGIDFGCAFGTSLQLLPIPELMPFRLTNQLCGVCDPVGVNGLLRSSMVNFLRSIRDNGQLLLNAMDIFIKDPSLDWTREALKQARPSDLLPTPGHLSWYPKQKIEISRRKLEGDNPVSIMAEELSSRRDVDSFPLQQVLCCIYGAEEFPELTQTQRSVPRGYSLHSISVDDQVSCLIELAVDPLVLARTWHGWEPWM